jgi:hypothetical protein
MAAAATECSCRTGSSFGVNSYFSKEQVRKWLTETQLSFRKNKK